jgi:hypothetical protein
MDRKKLDMVSVAKKLIRTKKKNGPKYVNLSGVIGPKTRGNQLTWLASQVGHKVQDQVEGYRIEDLVRHVGEHGREGLGGGMVAADMSTVLGRQLNAKWMSWSHKAYCACFSTMPRWAYRVRISRAEPNALSRMAKKMRPPRE